MKFKDSILTLKLFQKIGTAFFLSLSIQTLASPSYFETTTQFQKAYLEITALNLEKGKAMTEVGKRLEPDNKLYVLLENYIDFLQVFTTEDETDFNYLKHNKDQRLQQIRKGPSDSPYYLYAQAEINIQWAFTRVRFREYWTAAWELRRAFRLLEQNIQKFPEFSPNYKSHSLIRILAGSIPEQYHWMVNIFGVSPNLESGLQTLEKLVNTTSQENFLFHEESLLILCMIKSLIEMQPLEALKLLKTHNYPSNQRTMTYFTAIHIGLHNRENKQAMQWMEELQSYFDFSNFPTLYYLKGLGKLQNLDSNSKHDFITFLKLLQGPHQIKNTYQKLAWVAWIENDTVGYIRNIEYVKTKGVADSDSDKQAMAEAESGRFPHRKLLKIRLLTDGGDLTEAFELFESIVPQSLQSDRDEIEFFYRKARIFHFAGNTNFAMRYYEMTLNKGYLSPYYFAANSALQMGFLHEENSNLKDAEQYYKICLELDGHAYKQSIDQRAKAGLRRIR